MPTGTPVGVAGLVAVAVLVWPRSTDPGRLSGLRRRAGESPSGLRKGLRLRIAHVLGAVRLRGRQRSLEGELIAILEGLTGGLRAGLTPMRALAVVRSTGFGGSGTDALSPLLEGLATTAAAGGRLEPVWRRAADELDSSGLRAVAAAWGLSERHGAPVVDVLDALVTALRDRVRTAAAVDVAMAAPRATARLLGVLPLGGVLLGELVGVHPLGVLLGTPPGRLAGAAGLVATAGGHWWMRRLVTAVGRP